MRGSATGYPEPPMMLQRLLARLPAWDRLRRWALYRPERRYMRGR